MTSMNLPLQNPPVGWTVSRGRQSVLIEKSALHNIDNRHVAAAAVVGVCPLLFETFIGVVVQGAPLADAVFTWRSVQLMLFVPLFVGLALLARKYLGSRSMLTFTPETLRMQCGQGKQEPDAVPRNRVVALVRYVDTLADTGESETVSLVLDWRKANGEDAGVLLSALAVLPEEQQWLIRVVEAWSGQRLRTHEFRQEESSEQDAEA